MESESTFELMSGSSTVFLPSGPGAVGDASWAAGLPSHGGWNKRVKALSVLLWLELVNMFLSRIQTPCRPLVSSESSVYYFWCTKMPMILVFGLLDGSCSEKCVLFCWFQVRLEHPIAIGPLTLWTKHFLGWSIQLHAAIRYQILYPPKNRVPWAPENPWGFSSGSVEIQYWKPRVKAFLRVSTV